MPIPEIDIEKRFQENITSSIANSLLSECQRLYIVDLKTDEFTEYSADADRNILKKDCQGSDFFDTFFLRTQDLPNSDDRKCFRKEFTKENILNKLNAAGKYIRYYRLRENESPIMMVRAEWFGKEKDEILVTLLNVDDEARQYEKEPLIHQERILYDMLYALSGSYIALYSVDIHTDHYTVFRNSMSFEKDVMNKDGDHFFNDLKEYAEKHVVAEDLKRTAAQLTKENLLKEIRRHGRFAIQLRLLRDPHPVWVLLKAVPEKNDDTKIIIGISDIDAYVRRETEYTRILSMAYKDALTGVKNRMAYMKAEEELNRQIAEGNPEPFAVALFDVNDLKTVNDQNGHLAGDEYLKASSRIICSLFKHSPVYRIGGDEFLAIVKGTDLKHADAILQQLDEINRKNAGSTNPVIAYSLIRYTDEENMTDLFRKADKQLYAEKNYIKGHSSGD